MNKYLKLMPLIACYLWLTEITAQQCFPNLPITAAYANPTTSQSPYANKVLWLTWGSTFQNQAQNPYGSTNQNINVGSKSRSSIDLGGGIYLCVEAEVTNIVSFSGSTNSSISSYIPGTYSGDFLDFLYNIGGIRGTVPNNQLKNRMVSGIINTTVGGGATITFKCRATIQGMPVRLAGLVVADAESLSASEKIEATAKGNWSVVEVKKNNPATTANVDASNAYLIRKEGDGSGSQTIKFLKGNDTQTGAVAFLSFVESAYNLIPANNPDFSVTFTTSIKGSGKTAVALGLLTPTIDLGDAPESYGSPKHLLQGLKLTGDNIMPVSSTASEAVKTAANVNINTTVYTAGALMPTLGKYLGSMPPDSDTNGVMYSKDALGDDRSPVANPLPNEEDAWPEIYKRFSYKAYYTPGNVISATIPYKGGVVGDKISGWIDFNLNGVFDDDERATKKISIAGESSVMLSWTVPSNRIAKNTYVRLRYFDANEDPTSPTSSVNFGEVEDHAIYILTPGIINPNLPSKSN